MNMLKIIELIHLTWCEEPITKDRHSIYSYKETEVHIALCKNNVLASFFVMEQKDTSMINIAKSLWEIE